MQKIVSIYIVNIIVNTNEQVRNINKTHILIALKMEKNVLTHIKLNSNIIHKFIVIK